SITACGAVGVSSILTFRFGESNERSEFDSLQLERVGVTDTLSDVASITFRFQNEGEKNSLQFERIGAPAVSQDTAWITFRFSEKIKRGKET
ncbi:MAG: hypothetical protein AABY16_03885, partial [Nanoarchaeota archaeon]